MFNRRGEQLRESAEQLPRVLRKLSEECEYGRQRDQLEHDRLVGMIDIKLSEKLRLHAHHILDKALMQARPVETV